MQGSPHQAAQNASVPPAVYQLPASRAVMSVPEAIVQGSPHQAAQNANVPSPEETAVYEPDLAALDASMQSQAQDASAAQDVLSVLPADGVLDLAAQDVLSVSPPEEHGLRVRLEETAALNANVPHATVQQPHAQWTEYEPHLAARKASETNTAAHSVSVTADAIVQGSLQDPVWTFLLHPMWIDILISLAGFAALMAVFLIATVGLFGLAAYFGYAPALLACGTALSQGQQRLCGWDSGRGRVSTHRRLSRCCAPLGCCSTNWWSCTSRGQLYRRALSDCTHAWRRLECAAAGVPPAANARPQVAQVSASVARLRRQQHASGFYNNMVVAPLAVLASCLQPGGCAPKELRDKMKTQT